MNDTNSNVIAIDIGASHTRVSLFSKKRILKYKVSKTPNTGNSGDVISDLIISLIRSELSASEITSVKSIGVSSAGPLNTKSGEIINSPNMNFPKIKIKQPLEEEFSKDVFLINDCRSGVLGEIFADRNLLKKDVVYITFSTGIGAGAYIDGNHLSGKKGNAGEAGHFFVDSKYYLHCRCGGFGHWEAYSSGTGIPAFFKAFCSEMRYNPKIPEEITPEFILRNASQNTEIFYEFADELSKINGRGISTIIAAYSPDIIILDGPVVQNNSDVIINGINRYTDRYLDMPDIKLSSLEGFAPLYGAAYLAMTHTGNKEND